MEERNRGSAYGLNSGYRSRHLGVRSAYSIARGVTGGHREVLQPTRTGSEGVRLLHYRCHADSHGDDATFTPPREPAQLWSREKVGDDRVECLWCIPEWCVSGIGDDPAAPLGQMGRQPFADAVRNNAFLAIHHKCWHNDAIQ